MIERGLERARWPGRLEIMKTHPYIMIDGAHNPQGAGVLRKAIEDIFEYKKLILILGILRDKDVDGILRILPPLAGEAVITKPVSPRAMAADELNNRVREIRPELKTYCTEDIDDRGIDVTGKGDLMLVCGSLYLVGEVRKILKKM